MIGGMTTGETTPRIFTNQTLRLHELADDEGYISNVLVQDCTILGPAVLAWGGINLTNCSYSGSDVESVIWPVARTRHTVVGAFMARESSFENCQFVGVGIAMPEDEIASFLG